VVALVVDASVVVDGMVSSGVRGNRCRAILQEHCFVPELLFSEVASALARWERHTGQAAEAEVSSVLAFGWTTVSHGEWGSRLWALRHDLSLYDATYVAIAQTLDIALATTDRKFATIARKYCDVLLPE